MAERQITELNHRHMAIAEYLINHPSARLHEVAAAVGMSVSWVCIVTNSELFKDYFMRRHKELANLVHIPLQDKLNGVAHLAVEKLGRAVEDSTDPNFILAAADKALGKLGYGATKAPTVQVNNNTQINNSPGPAVASSVVEEARAKILQLAGVQNGPSRLPPAAGVQTREESDLGSFAPRPALVYQEKEAQGEESSRSPLRTEGSGFPGRALSPTLAAESLD